MLRHSSRCRISSSSSASLFFPALHSHHRPAAICQIRLFSSKVGFRLAADSTSADHPITHNPHTNANANANLDAAALTAEFPFLKSFSSAELSSFRYFHKFLFSSQFQFRLFRRQIIIQNDKFNSLANAWLKHRFTENATIPHQLTNSAVVELSDLLASSVSRGKIVDSFIEFGEKFNHSQEAKPTPTVQTVKVAADPLSAAESASGLSSSLPDVSIVPEFEERVHNQKRLIAPKYDPALKSLSDLRLPHDWFPAARAIKRRIILHIGPTNSGKTHDAMGALMKAESGIYLGPLRLLAWEVHEKLMAAGVKCNLLTGQEQILPAGAKHSASTAELSDVNTPIDVGIIDECQMLATSDRGGYWTRAVLGIPAKELHICGDPTIKNLVQQLIELTGDELTIVTHKRLTPLNLTSPIDNLQSIQRGDCVVAFSRKQLYLMKQKIETITGLRVGIIYGSLPPETRKSQAAQFNDPNGIFDVLVASDAIGMGLNLNIRRIIFESVEKFDGTESRLLTSGEALQIAGRAGRFKSQFPQGLVTTLRSRDYLKLKAILFNKLKLTEKAGIIPSFEQIQSISNLRPELSLSSIMRYFNRFGSVDELYFICKLDSFLAIADLIDPVTQLSLKDRFALCLSPIDVTRSQFKYLMLQIAKLIQLREPIGLELIKSQIMKFLSIKSSSNNNINNNINDILPDELIQNISCIANVDSSISLSELEDLWTTLDFYCWLAKKFNSEQETQLFVHMEKAEAIRNYAAKQIENALSKSTQNTNRSNNNQNQMSKRINSVQSNSY